MKKRKIVSLLLIIIFQFLVLDKLEAITIFVDGMGLGETFVPEIIKGRGTFHAGPGYLADSSLGKTISESEKDKHRAFRFSPKFAPDVFDKEEVRQSIDSLKNQIITIHDNNEDEPINIVSHSYGTVIAYKALEEISSKDIKIDTLITMGSPLGEGSIAQEPILDHTGAIPSVTSLVEEGIKRVGFGIPANESLEKPENVENWINYYAMGDVIGGKIDKPGVKDMPPLPGSIDPIKAHESYYKENAHYIASDFNLATNFPKSAERIFDLRDTVKAESVNFSQQAVINTSTQQALEFPKILSVGLPKGQIPPELAKKFSEGKLTFDSSRLQERTSHSWAANQLNLEKSIGNEYDIFCARFLNDQYWIEAVIRDNSHIISSATISGSNISGSSPLTLNLYPDKPNQWWSDPNVYMSTGASPEFPLQYNLDVTFKSGTSKTYSQTINSWEWAE